MVAPGQTWERVLEKNFTMMAFSALLVSLKVALPPSADPVPAPAINTMLAPAIPNKPKMVVAANLYIAASIWLLGEFLIFGESDSWR